MAARSYTMGRRAGALEATRQRIVDATVALHGEKGVLATSMQDIAARADVALGTVYRHFPALDQLVPACGARLQELTQPPGPEIVAGVHGIEHRIETLVRELFAYYARAARWIDLALCDQRQVLLLEEAMREAYAAQQQLVREALRPAKPAPAAVRAAVALTDFYAWKALERAGINERERVAFVSGVIAAQVARSRHA